MRDVIVRAISKDGSLKAMAICSTQLVERARQIHKTLPTATAALGRVLTACSMMGNLQKADEGSVTLQIKGGGPIGMLLATADPEGNVRGWVEHPQISLMEKYRGKLDVGSAVGCDGTLTVIRDLKLKEPYVGQTQLQTGEIAEDLTYYFAASEQVPSSVGLGVLMEKNNTVKQAGGFIVQLMPFAEEKVIEKLEANLSRIHSVTKLLEDGNSPEQILGILLEGMDMEILSDMPVEFYCNCSRERVAKALYSIGKKEMDEMIRDGEPIEVKCHFCNTAYQFSVEDLIQIRQLQE